MNHRYYRVNVSNANIKADDLSLSQNFIPEKELNAGKPKLNKNSEKIAEKISGNQPAYMRLYNKRGVNQKIKEEVEEKLILKEKEEEKKHKFEEVKKLQMENNLKNQKEKIEKMKDEHRQKKNLILSQKRQNLRMVQIKI